MTETNNVYRAFQHILENYDGLSTTDIDYGNLATERNIWKCGRQLTEKKKSNEYLKELAKHSFVGIYPTRKGLRGLKAWYEDRTSVETHDESDIIEILSFKKSPISKVYNDFKINYDWSPGAEKYNKSVFITHIDESSFPEIYESSKTDVEKETWDSAGVYKQDDGIWKLKIFFPSEPDWPEVGQYISLIGDDGYLAYFAKIVYFGQITGSETWYISCEFNNVYSIGVGATCSGGILYLLGSCIPKWTTYVGGVPDYTSAKTKWTICHNSWLQTRTVNPLIVDCPWFIDNNNFEKGTGGTGDTASVNMYLGFLVSWTTRQKDIVEYLTPITATKLQRDLLDYITFKDVKYTKDVNRYGWIIKIKINPGKKTMVFEVILIPDDIEDIDLIIETGDAADTYTERGDQGDDTITEGAQ